MNFLVCILLSLSPFIYIPSLFDFANLPQTVFIQTVIFVLLFSRLLVALLNRSFLYFPVTPFTFIFIVYFLWIWLSLLWAHNRYEAFLFNSHMLICALVPFILTGNPVSAKWKKWWVLSLSLGCAGVSIIGCLQHFLGVGWIRQVYPPAATFGNKNMAAEFVCMILTLFPGMFFAFQKKYLRMLVILSAGLALTFLFCSKCRAGWLAALISLFISCLFLYREAHRPDSLVKLSRKVLIKAGIGIFIIILAVTVMHPTILTKLYTATEKIFIHPSYTNGESSISLRLKIWRNSFEMIKDHWMIGIGGGNFKVFYPIYHQKAAKDTIFDQHHHPNHAHNDLIQHTVEFGLAGAALFLGILFYPLWFGYRLLSTEISSQSRLFVISVCGGMIGFTVLSMFGFPCARALPPLLFFFYVGILLNISLSEKKERVRYSIDCNRMAVILVCLLVAIGGFFLTQFNIRNLFSDRYYNSALFMEGIQNWNETRDYGLRANELNPFNTEVLSTVGLAYAQTGQLTAAIETLKKVTDAYPYHMSPLINLAATYKRSEDLPHAIETLERVREIKPDHVKVLADLGMLYTKNNDLAKALECFRKAASCAPLNPFIHTNLGSILLEQQRYAEAAREYELVLTIDPKLTDVHKNLALLYYDQLGQRLKAFFHMQKYIESNPSDQLSAMFGKLMDSFEKQDGAF